MNAPPQVLIVDDEALIRLDLAVMLADEGYQVVGQAGDGLTAVRLAEELRPDVVLMDIKMPIMDGIEAAERINAERIAPVVFVTAFSNRDLRERAGRSGAYGYLVKPITRNDLVPAIDMALSRYAEQRVREEMAGNPAARQAVERAQGFLMGRFGLSEPEALTWMQDQAIDRRLAMAEVAEQVLSGGIVTTSSARPELVDPLSSFEVIAVEAYLATDDEPTARRVFAALDEVARLLGYQDPVEESLERGSIWRRAKAALRSGLSSREVRERLIKVERALEVVALDARQAEVDGKFAEAVSVLVASLADVPEACLRVGSILLVKHYNNTGPVLVTRNLSQLEMRALERYPEIQAHPKTTLAALATAVASLEIGEEEPAGH
ncbi:ANTAR domain-containing response regulator [Planotetraspora sp. GP83]|uniref:ANTAR domain-containing response regulator n=1 Tax=Planotetraspora sp. GP83 TaxID=3156264 RepID=UPI0035117B8B